MNDKLHYVFINGRSDSPIVELLFKISDALLLYVSLAFGLILSTILVKESYFSIFVIILRLEGDVPMVTGIEREHPRFFAFII
jgi:hypothetical protein